MFGELAADASIDVLFGPTLSNTAFAADPVAQAAGLPVVAISNTAQGITDAGDYIFRVPLSDEKVIPAVVETVAATLTDKTAALLYATDDAFSTLSAEMMRVAAAANGIEIVTEQTFATTATDFTAQLDAVCRNRTSHHLPGGAGWSGGAGCVTGARCWTHAAVRLRQWLQRAEVP